MSLTTLVLDTGRGRAVLTQGAESHTGAGLGNKGRSKGIRGGVKHADKPINAG